MDKSYRIHANVSNDVVLNVNMKQDFDFLEILSLKLNQEDTYRLHSSNYGVIVGRVLANDAFGIPNARVSVFIESDGTDSKDIEAIYPYSEVTSTDTSGRRYNLLPDSSDDDCYRVVGTFPNKRLVLDDNTYMEVYDKYWKYTTVTNQAGDYMIFGVPSGSQQLHVDIDLSDIGILSQKPRDFEYKGYNLSMFDNASQFKESTNLEGLAQLFSQNKGVFVYPFWGDEDNGIAAITRSDIQIQYKFEPTCVFMGAIVSDNEGHAIGHKCSPDQNSGLNNQLITGNGTIEMIRKTVDGLVEEYQIQGNQLIDEDGVWCYQIPMNLDYIGTDEYGNLVPTDNPNKGIPTRAQVRFRFSKTETGDEGFSRHTAKYLVPQNVIFDESKVVPTVSMSGAELEKMYEFGSATPDWCFRDLYWNNVYSVKNYLPRTQVASRAASHNYFGLKGSNLADDQNPIPFNKLRIDLPFMYIIVCILVSMLIVIVTLINGLLCAFNMVLKVLQVVKKIIRIIPFVGRAIAEAIPDPISCLSLQSGFSDDNTIYFPGCWCKTYGDCPENMENCDKSSDGGDLLDNAQRALALEHNIVKLDFYQDWLNGTLYLPLWHWRKRKKKSFLFGLFSSKAKNEYCSCEKNYGKLKTTVTCNIVYNDNSMTTTEDSLPSNEKRWQSYRSGTVRFKHGLIKPIENRDGLTVYYYNAVDATSANSNPNQAIEQRKAGFEVIRLFSTDIILLGNLNENNLYGIPQFFTCLPSTTANIPPIATVEESVDELPEEEEGAMSDAAGGIEDSGTTITTGMDWGEDGGKNPKFNKGLFMDLACTVVYTRAKSCINVERLSELGVSLDMSFDRQFRANDTLMTGTFQADGLINKIELDDNDNRAMFATMNHIGFIPQSYQDSIGAYQTQIYDENTNYLVNKFKYIYPVDFDGRMKPLMRQYKGNFKQAMDDEQDQSYLTFRLGAEQGEDSDENSEGRIRHFYHDDNGFSMPVYNNSFYFYFGVNKGNTAIDKFNEKFYAQCFQNNKNPFTLDVTSRGVSYCPSAYCADKIKESYGYIKVVCDDIRAPYSYTLMNGNGDEIISESGMTAQGFVIGGTLENGSLNGDVIVNDNGVIKYQLEDKVVTYTNDGKDLELTLANQDYIISLTDADGKTMTQAVTLEMPKISGQYGVRNLGTRFYSIEESKLNYICNDETQFYGEMILSGLSIDGYDCVLGGVESVSATDDTYSFTLILNSAEENPLCGTSATRGAKARLEISLVNTLVGESDGKTKDCLCDSNDANINDTISGLSYAFYDVNSSSLIIYVYQPAVFAARLTQLCYNEETKTFEMLMNNSSSTTLRVENGENFITFLNDMPTRFMLGTNQDDINASTANESKFYSSECVESPTTEENTSGWFGVHDEASYKFPTIDANNEEVWDSYVDFDDINSIASRRQIISYKFKTMFSLSKAVYVNNNEDAFRFSAQGGVQPILFRSVTPLSEYLKSSNDSNSQVNYLLTDGSDGNQLSNYPDIVGDNYIENSNVNGIHFNAHYGADYKKVGNYFAAFTNDGGYVNTSAITSDKVVIRSPSYASVSPMDNNVTKRKGRDEEKRLTNFSLVYTKGTQQLAGDVKRQTQPYLRALTVDRRLDYDFTIFMPFVGSGFNLYDNAPSKEFVWKSGRISGVTLNGIEMSYDADYNIINDGSSEDGTLLEYSYNITDGKTVRNTIGDGVWEDDGNGVIIKRLYSAEFGESDIRNFFWSTFNKKRLYEYCNGLPDSIMDYGQPMFAFKYPYEMNDLYNGDFSIANYPTKRFIDLGNIPSYSYRFILSSCGYNTSVSTDETQVIRSEIKEVDVTELSLSPSNPIQFVQPDGASNDYANVTYKKDGNLFSANKLSLNLRFNETNIDGFDVYTSLPVLLKVLPLVTDENGEEKDGISMYKSFVPSDSVSDVDKYLYDEGLLISVSQNIFDTKTFNLFDAKCPEGIKVATGFTTKSGKKIDNWRFFKNNSSNEWVTSNDTDFLDINMSKNDINIDYVDAFAVLVNRELWSTDDDMLTKRVRMIELSNIIDTRPINLSVANDQCYIILESMTESGQTSGETSGETSGSSEDNVYMQVVTFQIMFDNVDGVKLNQSFTNYETMSFSMKFRNSFLIFGVDMNSYYIDNVQVTPITETNEDGEEVTKGLYLSVVWTQDMGLLPEKRWNGNYVCYCSIFAKTSNGFTYRIGDFTIDYIGSTDKDKYLPTEVGQQVNTPIQIK